MEIMQNNQIVDIPNEAVNEAAKRGAYTGAVIKRVKKSKECDDKIISYVMQHGMAKTSELPGILNIPDSTVRQHVRNLGKTHPNIKTSYGKVEWVDTKEPEKTPAEAPKDKYPFPKNSEGYNDYTAASVAKKTDNIRGAFVPGDIWEVDTKGGVRRKYLVLASYKGAVTCVPVKERNSWDYNPVYCSPVSMVNNEFVDLRFMVTRGSAYFLEKLYEAKNYDAIKTKLSFLLGIEPVERVVEKEVIRKVPVEKEVIKEVPVEKIVEKEVIKEVPVEKGVDSIDIALTKQKAEIYESLTWAMLVAIGGVPRNAEE